MINVLINGSTGNMGRVLKEYISKFPDMIVKYEIDKDTSLSFENLASYIEKPDVIIDFSVPEASLVALDYAVCHLVPIVIATTGFTKDQNRMISEYAQAIPIFKSSNMSYIIHLLGNLLGSISPHLSYMDIEIVEKHHRHKKDTPSRYCSFSC